MNFYNVFISMCICLMLWMLVVGITEEITENNNDVKQELAVVTVENGESTTKKVDSEIDEVSTITETEDEISSEMQATVSADDQDKKDELKELLSEDSEEGTVQPEDEEVDSVTPAKALRNALENMEENSSVNQADKVQPVVEKETEEKPETEPKKVADDNVSGEEVKDAVEEEVDPIVKMINETDFECIKMFVGEHPLASIYLQNGIDVFLRRANLPDEKWVTKSSLIRFSWQMFYTQSRGICHKENIFLESFIPFGLFEVSFDDNIEIPTVSFETSINRDEADEKKSVSGYIKNITKVKLKCRKNQFPFQLLTESTDWQVNSHVGKFLCDIHPLGAIRKNSFGKSEYFDNVRVPECKIVTKSSKISFRWYSGVDGKYHFSKIPMHLVEVIERSDVAGPIALFYWLTKDENPSDSIEEMAEKHLSGVRFIIPKETWPFNYMPKEREKRFSPPYSKAYSGVHPLEQFKNDFRNGVLSLEGVYFRPESKNAFVNEFAKVQFKWLMGENKNVKLETLECRRIQVKFYDVGNRSKPVLVFPKGEVDEDDGEIEKVVVYCQKKDWPFDYIPDGEYDAPSNDINLTVFGLHPIQPIPQENDKNVISLRDEYFQDKEGDVVFFWLKGDNSGYERLQVPFNKIELQWDDSRKQPLVQFDFKYSSFNSDNDIETVMKDYLKKVKISLRKDQWPF